MKCSECGGKLASKKVRYHYTDCGLSNVWLANVTVRTCEACGDEEVVIPDMPGLHQRIAELLATKEARLKPEEIRFLRVHLGLSGKDFAELLSVRPETVSRWETDVDHEMKVTNEKFLRMMILSKAGPFLDYDKIKHVGEKSERTTARMSFRTNREGAWAQAAMG